MTAKELIKHLREGLTVAQLEALTPSESRELENLFYHWQHVTEKFIDDKKAGQ